MNSNLMRTHVGNHYLIRRADWDLEEVIEVKVLAKAYGHVKIKVISSGYFRVGDELWLSTDLELEEHWGVWGKAPNPEGAEKSKTISGFMA